MPGFVSAERVESALARALCMVLPSRREGYGMVVVEAAALGTPSVVVADPDNAAADLVSEGENGYVAPSASPEDLAAAIERVHAEGQALRERTAAWFRCQRRSDCRSRSSLETVLGGLRAPVGLGGQLRGALPREAGRASPAARAQRLGIGQRPLDPAADVGRDPSGSTSTAASPATSGSEARSEQTTGTPRTIASSTGRPKPS